MGTENSKGSEPTKLSVTFISFSIAASFMFFWMGSGFDGEGFGTLLVMVAIIASVVGVISLFFSSNPQPQESQENTREHMNRGLELKQMVYHYQECERTGSAEQWFDTLPDALPKFQWGRQEDFRFALASSPKTDPQTLAFLFDDISEAVQQAVHRQCSDPIVDREVKSHLPAVRLKREQDKTVRAEMQREELRTSPGDAGAVLDERVRRYHAVFQGKMTSEQFYSSPETAQMIEWLKEDRFRMALARNPETDPATLAQLAHQGPQPIRSAVFALFETDPELGEIVGEQLEMLGVREMRDALAAGLGISQAELERIRQQRKDRLGF